MKKERKENASHLVSILYPGIIKKKTGKMLSLFEVDVPRAMASSPSPNILDERCGAARFGSAGNFWGRIHQKELQASGWLTCNSRFKVRGGK